MRPVPLTDLFACTGARLVGFPPAQGACVHGVSTDSRLLRPGEFYLALKGEKFDGHDFLDAALDAGASALCASDAPRLLAALARHPDRPVPALLVDDTLTAYQRIAAWYRTTLHAHVLAVTGSVGKTSTRDLVAAALAGERSVHRTAGNLNNEIGLPKTLLEADDRHQDLVVEMGMRAKGEIAALTRIARPDAAAVTNIGTAHIEYLGSREGILAAKLEIAEGLATDGPLFLNLDDPYLRGFSETVSATGVLPATGRRAALTALRTEASADARLPASVSRSLVARRIRVGRDGTRFDVEVSVGEGVREVRDAFVPIPGIHAVRNALFGFAAAAWEGVSDASAASGIAAFEPTGSRMRISNYGRLVLIDDSYNASPESMEAAFAAQRAIASGRRAVAALGGMNELGAHAEAAHFAAGAAAAREGISLVFVTGPHAGRFADGFSSAAAPGAAAVCAPDAGGLLDGLLEAVQDGDVLLVKGSRSFGMEKVARAVAARYDDGKEDPA